MSPLKKKLTKQQSIIVMAIGGIVLALAIFITVEPGSTARGIKYMVGFIGCCILMVGAYMVGAYFRPMKPKVEPAK